MVYIPHVHNQNRDYQETRVVNSQFSVRGAAGPGVASRDQRPWTADSSGRRSRIRMGWWSDSSTPLS